ncbi:DUF5605 domain-containing protein [Paenibacillus sp. MMS20-IR301]|uniref:DUF5605 domain-containing protein n=1 Tax=Paenibacillus sp. MMS20-IR301 TaxID=2895946 RepID=UPI0028E74CDC|nr:DUF5605 domain-containing protein [Paenibacillus sp. MMS20-IR301]WNS44120.1 DUF5605 domain-containing protein [Paenibacillus sp. MMS20-IR301]
MPFDKDTKIGHIWANAAGRAILNQYVPELGNSPFLPFSKARTLPELAVANEAWTWPDELLAAVLSELARIPDETTARQASGCVPGAIAEADTGAEASAAKVISAPDSAERWGIFELELEAGGLGYANPFTDITLQAEFVQDGQRVNVQGFYDGSGIYKVRFMPASEGEWTYRTVCNATPLAGIAGKFTCTPPVAGNHGPVRVARQFHFAYADETAYAPVGTTCYAWIHQSEALQQETLQTLAESPFNKLRMTVFPKFYQFNLEEPELFPYEGSLAQGWDFTRFNPVFFRRMEERLLDLMKLGIEADLILFHAYDRWSFSEMEPAADDLYLRYLTARLSAFRNLWWSLANEYDLMWAKEAEDWERFAGIITEGDPAGHLISIHNCFDFYDYSRPWVTHCSTQRVDVYRTAENTTEWRERWGKPVVIDECAYEGNIDLGWGNITGQEMVRRFWEGAVRGGYVGHGETYLHPEEILWWSKGGKLYGSSPERIGFLRTILETAPGNGLEPLKSDWDVPCAGIKDQYYLYYYGFNQPAYRQYAMKPGVRYKAEIIDTWNMSIQEQPGEYEGHFRLELPGSPYIAVRLTAV